MNIFTDGSYSPQYKLGVGAYLIIDSDMANTLTNLTIKDLKLKLSKNIIFQTFTDVKGSTDVEQKILDIALQDSKIVKSLVTIYTDCQKTQSTDIYSVVHIKGHTKQINRTGKDKIFDVVDKAVRKELRLLVAKKPKV
jgi:hypothetical protein